ncbi:MAG: NTPase [candidate division WOR-3 bacterium]
MKYHLLLTGPPRVGKTTIIEKAIKELKSKYKLDGFITKEIREKGEREGFEIIKIDGERKIFSHINFKTSYKVGKYGVNLKNLEEIIEKIDYKNCDILIVDEIGKMELLSKKFFIWIKEVLKNEKPRILGVVGEKVLENLKKEIDFSKCEIIKVMYENRENLLKEILNFFP